MSCGEKGQIRKDNYSYVQGAGWDIGDRACYTSLLFDCLTRVCNTLGRCK